MQEDRDAEECTRDDEPVDNEQNNRPRCVASSVSVASKAWAFTQHRPLDTASFITEASRRGIDLNLPSLRELYRRNLLVPFLYIAHRPVTAPSGPPGSEPQRAGTQLANLRRARDTGRLRDLADGPFMPRLPFERRRQRSRSWWNGLLYSWHQLLVLPEIDGLLALRRYQQRDAHRIAWLPEPHPILLDRAGKLRTMAIALTALEARYLPTLDSERIQLVNAEAAEWIAYRESFDPVVISTQLGYSTAQARLDAEWLLSRAHRLDPMGDSWSRLIRRAPSRSWERLKDAALMALDDRIAAEILLLFYEDLAARDKSEPLPDIPRMSWHPLHERLSFRDQTLDEDLTSLGISPHPRVVLAVEGETEEVHAPLVWELLGYPDAPELMRLLKLGGVDRDLEKVAALAAAPLVSGRTPGRPGWLLIKPPTRLYIAVDPEGKYFTPAKVPRTRTAILNEIKAVLKAQGVTRPNPTELDELVTIRTWSERCYEYAHFSDEELADGILAVHTTTNGLTREQLIEAIKTERGHGKDIKEVWSQWEHKPGKPELAHALWPTLAAKIERCRTDPAAPVPEIAEVIHDAYLVAQRWRYLSFALSEEPGSAGT